MAWGEYPGTRADFKPKSFKVIISISFFNNPTENRFAFDSFPVAKTNFCVISSPIYI